MYCEIYGAKPEDVEFMLVPMPRLEIETIQDFKILHEIGALSPDMTVKLSRILLGEEPGAKRNTRVERLQATEPFPEKQQPGQPADEKPAGPKKPVDPKKPEKPEKK